MQTVCLCTNSYLNYIFCRFLISFTKVLSEECTYLIFIVWFEFWLICIWRLIVEMIDLDWKLCLGIKKKLADSKKVHTKDIATTFIAHWALSENTVVKNLVLDYCCMNWTPDVSDVWQPILLASLRHLTLTMQFVIIFSWNHKFAKWIVFLWTGGFVVLLFSMM